MEYVSNIIFTISIIVFFLMCNNYAAKSSKQRRPDPYNPSRLAELKAKGFTSCPENRFSFISQDFEEIKHSFNSSEVMIIDTCKNKYLITKYKVQHKDIYSECGKYGMLPASFESSDEMTCIDKFYAKNKGDKNMTPKFYFLTSILDINATGTFYSCVDGKETPTDFWAPFEPNNSEGDTSCAVFNLAGVFVSRLLDMHCDTQRLICEYNNNTKQYIKNDNNSKISTSNTISSTTASSCNCEISKNKNTNACAAICNNYTVIKQSNQSKQSKQRRRNPYDASRLADLKAKGFTSCPENRFSFILQDFEEIKQSFSSSEVMIIDTCKNKYLITKYMVLHKNIYSECGKYGMFPASFESTDEMACIDKFYVKNKGDKNMTPKFYYLTSIIDINASHKFYSCIDDKETPTDFWAPLEPNNEDGISTCAIFNLAGVFVPRLLDNYCNPQRLICEYNNNTKQYIKNNKDSKISTGNTISSNTAPEISKNTNTCAALVQQCNLKTIKQEGYKQIMQKLNTILTNLQQGKGKINHMEVEE